MSKPSLNETPLPGAVMPKTETDKMAPKKPAPANDRKPKPHYSDGADHDQTIPI